MIDFDVAAALVKGNRPSLRLLNPDEANESYRASEAASNGPVTTFSTEKVSQAVDEYRQVLKAIADEVADPLAEVEHRISQALKSDDEILEPMLAHVAGLAGKRLRPIMLLLSAKACGGVDDEAIRLAVAVELVHTATLVHDDILDEAEYRRHRPTLHRLFDRQSSLLVGDWLFTEAYRLCNQSSSTLPGRWLAQAAKDVCRGEIRQSKLAGDWSISLDDYLQMIGMKTGSLCAVSCRLGAWAGGANDCTLESLDKFGMQVGQAFQIHDDYLDYFGDEAKLGKPLGNDFADEKLTLPLLIYLNRVRPSDAERLRRSVRDGAKDAFRSYRESLRGMRIDEATKRYAENLSQSALASLSNLVSEGKLGSSTAVELLQKLATTAVSRAS